MKNKKTEILIVEDNANDAELMVRSLKQNHVANRVVLTQDGKEALDYIFCREQYSDRDPLDLPSVIFLDIKMPKVNGLEVLKQLKENKTTMSIPVIIVTSSSEDPDIKTAYKFGANSYVVKPVEFIQFKKRIDQLGLYWLIINEEPR